MHRILALQPFLKSHLHFFISQCLHLRNWGWEGADCIENTNSVTLSFFRTCFLTISNPTCGCFSNKASHVWAEGSVWGRHWELNSLNLTDVNWGHSISRDSWFQSHPAFLELIWSEKKLVRWKPQMFPSLRLQVSEIKVKVHMLGGKEKVEKEKRREENEKE